MGASELLEEIKNKHKEHRRSVFQGSYVQMDFKENLLQMEASRNRVRGGLWSMPGPRQYSKDTQDMLKSMMQESRLTHLQKRRVTDCLQKGTALPLTFDPRCLPPLVSLKLSRSAWQPGRRDAALRLVAMVTLTPGKGDIEKEKKRLQDMMSTGQEEPAPEASGRGPDPDAEDGDRFQEVLGEIEERRQFLADMASLGQDKKYINIINAEISQKIQELEMLEKKKPLPEGCNRI